VAEAEERVRLAEEEGKREREALRRAHDKQVTKAVKPYGIKTDV
jgi:hypothetical protein